MAWREKLGKETLTDEETTEFVTQLFEGKYSQNDCKGIYDKWAESYDKMVGTDYEGRGGPGSVADKADQLFEKNDRHRIRVLDAGAGTGLVGEMVKNKGFTNIDALDPSEGMLAMAKNKNIYTNYICEFLNAEPLDIPADSYDAIVFAGAFLAGHIPPTAFIEMHRLVKPGGFIIFAFADFYLEKEEMDTEYFYRILKDYEAEKKWQIYSIDNVETYYKTPQVKSGKCYALKVLN